MTHDQFIVKYIMRTLYLIVNVLWYNNKIGIILGLPKPELYMIKKSIKNSHCQL